MTPIELKQARWRAFDVFKEEVTRIWSSGEKLVSRCELHPEVPKEDVHAALLILMHGKPVRDRAWGNHVVYTAESYRLMIHPKLFDVSVEEQRRTLIHEACHIGYSGHGKKFIDFCRSVGGVVSGAAVGTNTNRVAVEQKFGARYKEVAVFNTEQEAMAHGRSLQQAYRMLHPQPEPGLSIRLAFI